MGAVVRMVVAGRTVGTANWPYICRTSPRWLSGAMLFPVTHCSAIMYMVQVLSREIRRHVERTPGLRNDCSLERLRQSHSLAINRDIGG